MLFFFIAQALTFLLLVCPGSMAYRLVLLVLLIRLFKRHPLHTFGAFLWQIASVSPGLFSMDFEAWTQNAPIIQLRCDKRFWFICSGPELSIFVQFFSETQLGKLAAVVRDFVEERCHSWDNVWGGLAFSMLMGGAVDSELKGLYRQLGFLHVLVISGSQFSLISRWLGYALSKPFQVFYALTIIDWRVFRNLRFLSDFVLQVALLIYLLACGATPPCQRAFLEQNCRMLTRWNRSFDRPLAQWNIFSLQAFLFPESWFSLSNVLSWGAILSLKYFFLSKSLIGQLRVSLAIQLLSLALFARISLTSLYLDFFISPLWDLFLFISLAAILVPELGLQEVFSEFLRIIHEGLARIDLSQAQFFGSSLLVIRQDFSAVSRVTAAIAFVFLICRKFNVPAGSRSRS